MADPQQALKEVIASAEEKLRALEDEQEELDSSIEQTRLEIEHLERAISSFQELEDQLPS